MLKFVTFRTTHRPLPVHIKLYSQSVLSPCHGMLASIDKPFQWTYSVGYTLSVFWSISQAWIGLTWYKNESHYPLHN